MSFDATFLSLSCAKTLLLAQPTRENAVLPSAACTLEGWCYKRSLGLPNSWEGCTAVDSKTGPDANPGWRITGRRCWNNCYRFYRQWLSTDWNRDDNWWRRLRGRQWIGESSLAFYNSSLCPSRIITLRTVAWMMNSCGEKVCEHLWIAAYSFSETVLWWEWSISL